ncbi:MAG: RnfABCDGE type electron transport complex subunit B [Clostridiales bacterium]|nr:RnfABCDGE type electron transport complex subunit B [Candidatus Equinaster intestinalis]
MKILFAVIIMTVLGLLAGVILAFASKFFAVPTDEKFEKIRACLPGANCGACGYAGCDGYAEAINKGEAAPDKCPVGGANAAAALSEVLGVEIKSEKKVAFVRCQKTGEANTDYLYSGRMTCADAAALYGGPLSCKAGCIGIGDCVKVCDFGAIKVENGVAKVDKNLCTACGKCAKACPKGIIAIVNCDKTSAVACMNTEKGAVARKNCTSACIGCMKCVKTCEAGAITVENNLARIDASKCTACGKCIEACPDKCIVLK